MSESLSQKFGLLPGQRLLILNPPDTMLDTFQKSLRDNEVTTTMSIPADVVLFFSSRLAEVNMLVLHALQSLKQGGALWVAYPKTGGGIRTNLSRERLAEAIYSTGWRTVQEIDLDAVWNAMCFLPASENG